MKNNYLSLVVLFLLSFTCEFASSISSLSAANSSFLCLSLQSHALLLFKSTFVIDIDASSSCDYSFPKTDSWKEGTDCCSSWDGVNCDDVTGHVIELDLSCSQLRGIIDYNNSLFSSDHISPYLRKLNLAFNNFFGSEISPEFGVKFGSSLTHLSLSESGFSGNIPSNIFLLSNLVSLDLSASRFTGNVPYGISLLTNLVSLDLSSNNGLVIESDRVLESIARNLTRLRVLGLEYVSMSSVRASSLMNLSSSLVFLSLYNCSLRGEFPVGLLLLPNLQDLDLSNNNFNNVTSFPLPNSTTLIPSSLQFLDLTDTTFSTSASAEFLDFVSNLRSLESVNLFENRMDGPIPISFCNMTQLHSLYLVNNQLSGSLPSCLLDLPFLETLDLSDNKLHGQIPSSIFHHASLRNLDFSSNNFSGFLDFDVSSKFSNLNSLSLSNNNFSSSTSTNYNLSYSLPHLRSLDLSSCNLTQFPTFISSLTNLETLQISNNKIQGHVPKWMLDIGEYTLTELDLSTNLLTSLGQIQWKNLEFFDIHSNLLQGALPVPSTTTKFFSASKNSFSGEISILICNLSSLDVLDLSHNMLSGFIPPCIGNLSKLSVLSLGMNNLYGTIPNTFAEDSLLSHLNLNQNRLNGRLPRSLSYCQHLTVLDIGTNMIEDIFPHWLEILSILKVLVLRSNRFFGSVDGFQSKAFFPNLRILDVSDNDLVGELPTRFMSNLKAMMEVQPEYGGYMEASNVTYGYDSYSLIITVKGSMMEYEKILTMLTIINFSRNKFEGDIPEVIGDLVSLKGLNLSHNLMVGHIPPSMGHLFNLEWLDLSSNKLVGNIPIELTELTFLSVLNLSHNQLDGSIPQGKQFNTFGNESYKDNSGLCGFPLSKGCRIAEEATSETNIDSLDYAIDRFKWEGAFVGYGCGIVFGVCMGCLMFSKGWPKWFVRMVEGKRQRHRRVVKSSNKSGRKRSDKWSK